jgi:cytoskeletal protein RodZ
MDQITCPICRTELSSPDQTCPKCGYKKPEDIFAKNPDGSLFNKNSERNFKFKKVLFFLVFLILIASFFVYNSIINQNNLEPQKPVEESSQSQSETTKQETTEENPLLQSESTQQKPANENIPKQKEPAKHRAANIHEIKYIVTGTAKKGNVTIQIPGGGSEQHDVSLPYESPTYDFKNGDLALLIAVNQDDEGGSIIAEIFVDGNSLRKASSNGSYNYATVRWTIGSED